MKNFDRTIGLGGSDANSIWHNYDPVKLWELKTNKRLEDDLSDNFQVQLGTYTESFHVDWLRKYHKPFHGISESTHTYTRELYGITLYAHLDAIVRINGLEYILECKHSNSRVSPEVKARYYAPQLHHYMHILGDSYCYISIICGNDTPEVLRVDFNEEFWNRLKSKMIRFWSFVKNDKQPPVIGKPSDSDKEIVSDILVNEYKDYNMIDNTEYVRLDSTLDQYSGAIEGFEETKKKIKLLVPKDAKKVSYPNSNYVITRNKKGTLVVTKSKENDNGR